MSGDANEDGYLAIDADGHVIEPQECFREYLPAAFHERALGLVADAQGVRRFVFDGAEEPPFPREISIRKPIRADQRVAMLDKERIGSAVLFPSGGLIAAYAAGGELGRALTVAYNNWIADYVAAHRERLYFVAPLPLEDISWAAGEARRAVKLGARAVVIRPNLPPGQTWDDPRYEALYACVQDLGVPLIFHESTGDPHTAAGDRYGMRNPARYCFNHIISHSFEQMFAAMSVICGGVLERFPRLRVGFFEAGCSWVPYWLSRFDHHFGHPKLRPQMPIRLKPSEYFQRQCFVTCDPDDETLALAVAGLGADYILFATDFPHFDSAGGSVRAFLESHQLGEKDRRKILWENAARLYGIKMPVAA